MNKIESYEAACKALNINPNVLPDVSGLSEKDQKSVLAHYKLLKIAEALNTGWEPDWSNYNEYKYFPYFEMDKKAAGFGFSFDVWACTFTGSNVGSRLCFKTSTLAEYAGKQFVDLYREMMTGK